MSPSQYYNDKLNTGKLKRNQAVQIEGVLLKMRKASFTGARAGWPALQWGWLG